MTGPTRTLHLNVIRAIKAILAAWEKWVEDTCRVDASA